MATPHINTEKERIASTVLMPGDPLRAKFIADTYLRGTIQYNDVRGMLGFTGIYKGKRISVQGSGMGVPSMGIYSYELFKFFDVKNIIRVGTAGAISEELKIGDLVLAQGVSGSSHFASQYQLPDSIVPLASYELLEKAVQQAREVGCNFKVGNVICSDIFYNDIDVSDTWRKMGILSIEMESISLYLNAARLGRKALTITTISDELYSGKSASVEDRQLAYTEMIEIALEVTISLD